MSAPHRRPDPHVPRDTHEPLPDPLSRLLAQFPLHAGVFHAGALCGVHGFDEDLLHAHIHLVRRGPVVLVDAHGARERIDRPTIVFLPRPWQHWLIADARDDAEVLCANVAVGGGRCNPLTDSLPAQLAVPLEELADAAPLLAMLASEADAQRAGRQAMLDRLCELLVLALLRHAMDRGELARGPLAGVSDPRLSVVLAALHGDVARDWTLEALAGLAHLSRSRFAARFAEVVGQPVGRYLARLRVSKAQSLLRAGRPLKHVCHDVGYGSAAAFSRAFARELGVSPVTWRQRVLGDVHPAGGDDG